MATKSSFTMDPIILKLSHPSSHKIRRRAREIELTQIHSQHSPKHERRMSALVELDITDMRNRPQIKTEVDN